MPRALRLLPQVYAATMAAGVSGVLCYVGTQLAAAWGVPSQAILITTTLTLAAATALPRLLAPLSHSAEGLSLMLMQVRAAHPQARTACTHGAAACPCERVP